MHSENIAVVDLFCGAGGLTKGLELCGYNVLAGVDSNIDCEYPYQHNNRSNFIHADITTLKSTFVSNLLSDYEIKMICGCAPCQPFSNLTQKSKNNLFDPRWSLLNEFKRIVNDVRPDIILMENVPQLVNRGPFDSFLTLLKQLDYAISYEIIECERFGIPQKRKRLVLVATTLGYFDFEKLPTSKKNVYDAIGHLEPLAPGEKSSKDPLHRCQGMSEINIKRIQASRPGGSWKEWPDELKTMCHKKDSGASFCSAYSRMTWEDPSPTITTQFFNYGSGRFGHPEQDRALSLREGALLQTFPTDYSFFPSNSKYSMEKIARLIGNAVPVRLATIIGNEILNQID